MRSKILTTSIDVYHLLHADSIHTDQQGTSTTSTTLITTNAVLVLHAKPHQFLTLLRMVAFNHNHWHAINSECLMELLLETAQMVKLETMVTDVSPQFALVQVLMLCQLLLNHAVNADKDQLQHSLASKRELLMDGMLKTAQLV